MLRIVTAGAALLLAGANFAQAGILDALLGASADAQAGVVPAAPMCPNCQASGGTNWPAASGSCQCYGGHLPCCAEARGFRDRWRLWFTKKCRCLHHETFYPPAAPLYHPAWGYHQTCWRQFPPLPPCPPADAWLGGVCPMPLDAAPLPTGTPPATLDPLIQPPAPATPDYEPEIAPPTPFDDVPGAAPAPEGQPAPLDQAAPGASDDDLGLFEMPTDRTSSRR